LACLAVSFPSSRHMWSSLGDCPSEGRAEEGPCLESGSMPGRWHARGRTELAYLQGVATCTIQFDTRCPLARPSGGSPPTLAGALPPEFICGACPSSLSLAVSQLSACMCLSRESCFVLYCLHSCSPYVCVCINMNVQFSCIPDTKWMISPPVVSPCGACAQANEKAAAA
jgi:hypothetical protein